MITYILFSGHGPLLWRLEMMVLLINIADYVVVYDSILAWAEVPWLFLGVVWPVLKSFELVLKVEHVVSLFVAECSVLIRCKHLNHILMLLLLDLSFTLWVCEGLRDRVVLYLISLHKLTGNLFIGLGLTLEVIFSLVIRSHVLFPRLIAIVQADSMISLKSVTHLHLWALFLSID